MVHGVARTLHSPPPPSPTIGCQDFEGKRACDLTRDLKCLRLLDALKKAPEPSAISLRTPSPGRAATAPSGETGDDTLGPLRSSARAMANVDFGVSFLLGEEEVAEQTWGGAARSPRETPTAGNLERGEGRRAGTGASGTGVWVEGVARSYDVRNKMLFIDARDRDSSQGAPGAAPHRTTDCGGKSETENAATLARDQPADQELHGRSRAEQRRRSYARHVLDVRLLSCLSPRGEELFDQLRAFSCAFKTGVVRASLDVAIDAAADLGTVCREVYGVLVSEIVKEGIATEAHRSETLAVAANGVATAAVGSVLRAAQRATILARRFVSRRTARRENDHSSAAVVNNTGTEEERLEHERTISVFNSLPDVAERSIGETSPGHDAIIVDKSVAARMRFRCTAIVTEKRRKVPGSIVPEPAAGVGGEEMTDRKRHDLQYLARWT